MILNLVFGLLLAPSQSAPFKIVLDAGHGGRDGGAIYGDVKESEIVLAVCKELEKVIKASGDEFQVLQTRQVDLYKSLPNRAIEANRFRGDLFVSIHVNASRDQRARGAEFYFQNQLPAEEEALFLAAKENEKDHHENLSDLKIYDFSKYDYKMPNNDTINIVEDLARQTRFLLSRQLAESLLLTWDHKGKAFHKSLRQAPFYLLSNLKMPAALAEIGFLTNQKDAKELSNPDYHKQIAQNLFKGIVSYKEYMDKYRAKGLD
jgi:N-acetylmuramoyl-L-alanine amidase